MHAACTPTCPASLRAPALLICSPHHELARPPWVAVDGVQLHRPALHMGAKHGQRAHCAAPPPPTRHQQRMPALRGQQKERQEAYTPNDTGTVPPPALDALPSTPSAPSPTPPRAPPCQTHRRRPADQQPPVARCRLAQVKVPHLPVLAARVEAEGAARLNCQLVRPPCRAEGTGGAACTRPPVSHAAKRCLCGRGTLH